MQTVIGYRRMSRSVFRYVPTTRLMPRFSFPFSLAANDILYGLTTQSCAVVVLYPFQPGPWSYVQRCGRCSWCSGFPISISCASPSLMFLSCNLKCLRFPFFDVMLIRRMSLPLSLPPFLFFSSFFPTSPFLFYKLM